MTQPPPLPHQDKPVSARQNYNLVTDTVIGPNLRLRDNLFQLAFVVVFTAIGAGVGYAMGEEENRPGMLIGALAGLIAGTLLSGGFLMIYRATQHRKGRHD